MHLQEIPHLAMYISAHAFLENGDRVCWHRVDSVVQRGQLFFGERSQLLEREQARGEQNLVHLGVTDARHGSAPRENTLDLATVGLEVSFELLQRQHLVQHVRTLIGQPRHLQ